MKSAVNAINAIDAVNAIIATIAINTIASSGFIDDTNSIFYRFTDRKSFTDTLLYLCPRVMQYTRTMLETLKVTVFPYGNTDREHDLRARVCPLNIFDSGAPVSAVST